MSRLRKVCRRLLSGIALLFVFAGLVLAILHLGAVRRLALVQIQRLLAGSQGVALEARGLNYNLLSGWFEIDDVTFRRGHSTPAPAMLTAGKISVRIPVWRLLRGSWESARIRVDRLSVQWIAGRSGENNWPSFGTSGTGGVFSGPAIRVTSGQLTVRDERTDLQLHIPIAGLSTAWNATTHQYAIDFASIAGELHWRELRVPLDRIRLKSAIVAGGFTVQSLRIVSGDSEAEVGGTVHASRIEAQAWFRADARRFSRDLRGAVAAHIIATGPLEAPTLTTTMRGSKLAVKDLVVRDVEAESSLDTGTGELLIRRLSAGVFGGRLRGTGRIRIGGDGGGNEFTGSLDGVDLGRIGLPAGLAKVTFHAADGPDHIRLSFDAAVSGGVSLSGDVAYGPAGHTVAATVRGTIDSLAWFDGRLGTAVDGTARWSAAVGGTVALPTASVQLEVDRLSIGKWSGADVRVKANYAGERVAIESATVAWGGQHLVVNGEIGGLTKEAPLSLDGVLEGPSLAGVFDKLGITRSVEGAVSGEIRISGSVANPTVEAALRSANVTGSGVSAGQVEAKALLNVASEEYVLDAVGQDLQVEGIGGRFQIEAHGKGTLSDPALHAQLAGSEVTVGTTAVGDVRAKVDVDHHCATALLSAPALNVQTMSTVTMEGTWPFDLKLEARHTRLDTSPAASFDADVRASGTLASPRLEQATAGIRNFTLAIPGQEVVSEGPVELSYADGRVRVGKLALKSGNSVLRVGGELPAENGSVSGTLTVQGSVDLEPLSKWLPGLSGSRIGGVADFNASVTGNARNWQPTGTVALRGASLRSSSIPLPLEDIAGTVHLEAGVIRVDGITAKVGTGTLHGGGSVPLDVSASQPARFSAQLDQMEVVSGGGENRATAAVGFKIEGEASAWSLDALHARIEFDKLEAAAKGRRLQQTAPARITIADSIARLESFDFQGEGSRLHASGSIGLKGDLPLQLDLSGRTELAALSVLTPPLEAAGSLTLDVKIGGTWTAPRTTGLIELEHGSFTLPVPNLQAGAVKLRASLESDVVSVKELAGTLNGGAFRGGGDLKLGPAGIRDANLFVTGKDIFVEYPPAVKTMSTVDLKLVSRPDGLALQGKIDVQEGYYEASLDAFKSSPSFDANTEGLPGPVSRPLALDLQISTKRPVEMDNNLGRLAGTAELRLGGNVDQPQLAGTLQLEPDGKLYFGDRTYYIDRGTVRFRNASRIKPDFDIHAYTRSSDYTIWLGLTGELSEVTTTFTSDPPLSRDDVIAVLLTGKTVAENRGVDLRALEAASLATGALNASLSSQAHRTLGVSRVSIQPSAIAAESNPGARITITQDFTRSLRLLYSMNLSDSNDQIWVGEYDLTRSLTTRAVKQSDNSYRGEFRHDIRFGSSSGAHSPASAAAVKQRISTVQLTGGGPFAVAELSKMFKLKPGQQYQAMKVRKGSERLAKYLTKRGYLESRVYVDRGADAQGVSLTVRIELGPTVELVFDGAKLSRRERGRARNAWRAGISEQHRALVSKEAILNLYAEKGYLRAQVSSDVTMAGDRKMVRFVATPGVEYRGVKIAVDGAEQPRAAEIEKLLRDGQLRLSVYRDPRKAMEAITRFYQQRGYLSVRVAEPKQTLDPSRRTGRIVIPVQEGPLFHVDDLHFSGNQVLTAADLRSGLPLEQDAAFEPARVEPTVSALKLKYGKLGYREAQVKYAVARHDDRATVDVSFTIEENKRTSVGAIVVEGNRHTSAKFARGQLKVGAGDVANTALVGESVKNLSRTGAYTSADIQVRPQVQAVATDPHTAVADLVVAVSEPKPFRLLYGGLYDSGHGPGFIADFQNHNSLGAGRTLGLRTRVDSEEDEARLYLSRPFWRRSRLSTTLSTYFTREIEHHQSTPTETLGVSIQQDLPLRSKWLLSYGYRYEKQRGFVPDPAAPPIPQDVVSVAPVTLTFSRDARDSVLDATRGSFASHGFEVAPRFLGSDYPYFRYYVQYFKYYSLTHPRPVPFGEKAPRSRLVFATGSRVGLQKGFSKDGAVLTDRFFAGGGTTVRGFHQDELGPKLANGQPAGGNAVLVLNEEFRYPMFWIFDAVTFVDIGNVFPRVSDFKLAELRSAGGFGLRIRNPFVVLRFDYGFKFNRRPGESLGAFFFSIGQAF